MRQRLAPKSRIINMRVDVPERQTFERAAELSGLTLSAWLRMVAREAAERRLANAGESPTWTA